MLFWIIYSCSPRWVRNYNVCMRVEWWKLTIAHNLILGAAIVTKCVGNNKYAMHRPNMHVTAACKTPSHTQSKASYWLNQVNRTIAVLDLFIMLYLHAWKTNVTKTYLMVGNLISFTIYTIICLPFIIRWFKKNRHCSIEEAVQIHQDVQARKSLGIHWGTFKLGSEVRYLDTLIALYPGQEACLGD